MAVLRAMSDRVGHSETDTVSVLCARRPQRPTIRTKHQMAELYELDVAIEFGDLVNAPSS